VFLLLTFMKGKRKLNGIGARVKLWTIQNN